uniref:ELM2 domain-containing protein n=1 Tax=Theileria annulata TaxID=5874 RepID=A0A3B0MLT6_THEAN
MSNNFEEDIAESETSLQNFSDDDLSHLKQDFNNDNLNKELSEEELSDKEQLSESAMNPDESTQSRFDSEEHILENEKLTSDNELLDSESKTENSQVKFENEEDKFDGEYKPDDEQMRGEKRLLESKEDASTSFNKHVELDSAENKEKSPVKIITDEKKKKKPTTEGSNFQTKINVGYNHQVPFTPAFFLDHSYNNNNNGYKKEWARLMYSPYQMEKIRRRKLKEGLYDSVIKNEFELAEFIQMCAKNWKNNPGWHPFSPEFAYKILHFADYDPNKALKYMNDNNFNFTCNFNLLNSCICDPPIRRYDNKWKPKDRRGQVPTNPYPPPVTLRGYLLRRHTVK